MIHKDLQNPYYMQWIDFLKSSESWSESQIHEYQLAEVKKIINHAFNNTKGYRDLYLNKGVHPEDIKSLNDISKLPFVDKELLRDNLKDFTYTTGDMEYVTTGGSTGIPFGFYRDKLAFSKELASKAYQYYRIGWSEGAPTMVFRGLPIHNESKMKFYPEFNELRCSSYYLIPEQMAKYRLEACNFKPEFLKGYPSSLYIFARYLKETGKSFPPIKAILCASENLYDFQKKLFNEVFQGARVFSHYGHYELTVLAGYCEKEDTYHVLPQYGYPELIDKNGNAVSTPDAVGEIVGTSFLMTNTPFIRYRTRDFAVLKGFRCGSCGRHYQVWERIEGRLQEFIVTKTGRHISMTAINMHDSIFDSIKQFQFFQQEQGKVEFRYIPKTSNLSQETLEDIKKRLMVKLEEDVELTMVQVDDLAPTNRGKHRFLIQKLNLEFCD